MDSNDPHDSLSAALRQWRVFPRRDPLFRTSGWQRLGPSAPARWGEWSRSHVMGWSLATAIALVVAGWGGHALAQARLDADRNAMVVSYLSGLDPRVLTKLQP